MTDKAAEAFKEFKEYSVAEFFRKNRQMLGYSGAIKSLTTAVHEYVTNALDACEVAGILPDLYIELRKKGEGYLLIVEDNGPGIPKHYVGKVFGTMLAGTKFHVFKQQRGQQGIGATGVVMFSQVTTGKPTKIVTSTGNGIIYEADISIDIKHNRANVENPKEYPGNMRGTRIETELKGVLYQRGDRSPDEYLKRTALANPHAKITWKNPDKVVTVWDRAMNELPKIPKETKPHPKGIETDDLMYFAAHTKAKTIRSFLINDFVRISGQKATELETLSGVDFKKKPSAMTWDEAEQIVKAIQKTKFIAPPTDCLIPIGEKELEKAVKNVLNPEYYKIITRPPALYRGGVPFMVETAIAYGGELQANETKKKSGSELSIQIMRFANRVPLLFDAGGCAITKAVNSIDWKRYGVTPQTPLTVVVNLTSIHIPYTGAGKEAISEEEEITKEIKLSLQDTGRRVSAYLSGKKRRAELEKKKRTLEIYAIPVAEAIAEVTGADKDMLVKRIRQIVEARYEEITEEPEEEDVNVEEEEEEDE